MIISCHLSRSFELAAKSSFIHFISFLIFLSHNHPIPISIHSSSPFLQHPLNNNMMNLKTLLTTSTTILLLAQGTNARNLRVRGGERRMQDFDMSMGDIAGVVGGTTGLDIDTSAIGGLLGGVDPSSEKEMAGQLAASILSTPEGSAMAHHALVYAGTCGLDLSVWGMGEPIPEDVMACLAAAAGGLGGSIPSGPFEAIDMSMSMP